MIFFRKPRLQRNKKIVIPAQAGTQMFDDEKDVAPIGVRSSTAFAAFVVASTVKHLGPRFPGDDSFFCT